MGFVARAMKNFDLGKLALVNPRVGIGPSARMRAVHAQEILDKAQVYPSLSRALERVDLSVGTTAQRARSPHRILRRPATPKEFAARVEQTRGTVALVFGREGTGLTNKEMDLCDLVMTIPASEGYPTMNMSHAAAVIFYELFKNSNVKSPELLADRRVKEACLDFLHRAANSAGLSSRERGLALRAFRNIMGRSVVRAREASSLAGVFRKISDGLVEGSGGSRDL